MGFFAENIMKISWKSPSNLAIVKYWGKHGRQLPRNASISFTLDRACTEMHLSYQRKEDDGKISLDFLFEDKEKEAFAKKIKRFLGNVLDEFPFLSQYHLSISSRNSFPHSAGIASSASSMSALALCLCTMERHLINRSPNEAHFYRRASYIARLGSGSASRSVYPYLVVWGETNHVEGSSNTYAVPYHGKVDEVFKTFHDTILIISQAEKSVSSTVGHKLMKNHPFAAARYEQADKNMKKVVRALETGDLVLFGEVLEEEALMLHALMMTAHPPYILMEGHSIEAIKRVQAWRTKTKWPLYFSLDAGPNLHLLYPDRICHEVQAFIKSNLLDLCEGGQYLEDKVGRGATQLM